MKENLLAKFKKNLKGLIPLKGGLSNLVFLVDGKYVCRKKKESDPLFYSPSSEMRIEEEVSKAGIAPVLLSFDEKSGDKCEEYIETDEVFSPTEECLIKVVDQIKKIQSIHADCLPFRPIERYLAYRSSVDEILNEKEEEKLLKDVKNLISKSKLVLSHCDLVPGNLLFKKGRLFITDWEFAGLNHPLFDLASLLGENKIEDEEKIDLVLKHFLDKENIDSERKDLILLIRFSNYLWYYWAKLRFKETGNETFLEIASEKKKAIEK